MTTTWIGIAISVAWLLVVESAVASPAVGPREAVEAAVVRVLSIVQDGQAAGAPVADRSDEIRRIADEHLRQFRNITWAPRWTVCHQERLFARFAEQQAFHGVEK